MKMHSEEIMKDIDEMFNTDDIQYLYRIYFEAKKRLKSIYEYNIERLMEKINK